MTAELARKPTESSVSRPLSEDEIALDRVHEAEALLRPDAASGLQAFFAALYRGAPPEDITRYAPESLAALAELAFGATAHRKPGETLVYTCPFRSTRPDGGERSETIFVGANDDMPFLFDSLVADL